MADAGVQASLVEAGLTFECCIGINEVKLSSAGLHGCGMFMLRSQVRFCVRTAAASCRWSISPGTHRGLLSHRWVNSRAVLKGKTIAGQLGLQ